MKTLHALCVALGVIQPSFQHITYVYFVVTMNHEMFQIYFEKITVDWTNAKRFTLMEASGIQQVKGPKGCSVLLRSDSFHTDAERLWERRHCHFLQFAPSFKIKITNKQKMKALTQWRKWNGYITVMSTLKRCPFSKTYIHMFRCLVSGRRSRRRPQSALQSLESIHSILFLLRYDGYAAWYSPL